MTSTATTKDQQDQIYYLRRIAELDLQAEQATIPSARLAYREMARLYRERLTGD